MAKKPIYPVYGGMNKQKPEWMLEENEWADVLNVRFTSGSMKKCEGWSKYFASALTGEVYKISPYYTYNGDSFLMFHTPTKTYQLTGAATVPTDITATALNGLSTAPVFSENAENKYIFTNGVDPVQAWSGSGNIAALSGLSGALEGTSDTALSCCRCLVYFNNFLILGNTKEGGIVYPQRIRWSQVGNISKWTNETDGSGQAGYADITDGSDQIQAMCSLKNYLIVYKERSIHILSYSGGDVVFSKEPAIMEVGLIAPGAIANLGIQHVFIGNDDIYAYDLVQPKKIGTKIAKDFFRLLDPSYKTNIVSSINKQDTEILFAFTSINSTSHTNDMALVINYQTGAWSIRELPMTSFGEWTVSADAVWNDDEETWDEDNTMWDDSKNSTNAPVSLCGDASGYVYKMEGNSKDGSDLSCYAVGPLLDLEDSEHLKRLKRIQFQISREGDYYLDVYIGTADNVEDPIVWYGPYQMSLDSTSYPWIDPDLSARYFQIKLGTDKMNEPFELSGMVLYYDVRSET